MTLEEKQAEADKADIDKLMIFPKNYTSMLVIAQPNDETAETILVRKIGNDPVSFLALIASAMYQDRILLRMMMEAMKATMHQIEEDKKEQITENSSE